MKILMITPYLPYPPSAGGQIRSYNLIKNLSQDHDITLACFTRDTNTEEQVEHMKKFCKKVVVFQRGKAWTLPNIIRTGFSLYPFLVMIYYNPDIKPMLQKELDEGDYDVIHAETFYVMPYLPKTNVPVFLAEQVIMSKVFAHEVEEGLPKILKPLLKIDVAKIRYWEKKFWEKADRISAVSAEDAQEIQSRIPTRDVQIIPNGVGEDFEKLPSKIHRCPEILYMGNYKWMQNWEAAKILAQEVFPLIKKQIPKAKLNIAGQFPPPHLKQLASHDIIITELKDTDSKGVVNAYKNSGVLVAPIYGPSGSRLKILAAMSAMTPVITTPIGAEGIGVKDGESVLIGKTPREIAQKTIDVLSDQKLYAKIAVNAKEIVESGFTWGPISQKLSQIYKKMIHK